MGKIEDDTIRNAIFDFAYDIALQDSYRQKAYASDKLFLHNNNDARAIVKGYIDSLLEGKGYDFNAVEGEVEKSFEKFCKENNKPKFAFGNCQKLINMTAKYIYIGAYNDVGMKEKFEKCHCPMDSVMISKVVKTIKNKNLEEKFEGTIRSECDKTFQLSSLTYCSWSRLVRDESGNPPIEYVAFQKAVNMIINNEPDNKSEQQKIIPIEYDFVSWKH